MQSAVKNRKHLTPSLGVALVDGSHAMRRSGGARREVSDRVVLKGAERTYEGWALNVSRGGVRAILEEQVVLGAEFEVTVGDSTPLVRHARVVWLQEEKDGVVVGLEFIGLSLSERAAPPVDPTPDS
jgi:PilZ domain